MKRIINNEFMNLTRLEQENYLMVKHMNNFKIKIIIQSVIFAVGCLIILYLESL
jgi:hypothetical protein